MIDDNDILISGLQHFLFCRRQWALIHIEGLWAENNLTVEGKIQHTRVHNERIDDIRNGILTLRGLQIRSDRLGLAGICDAVEFIQDNDGIILAHHSGKWKVRPVEYKHGRSKINDCDRVQAVAQAMCLEEMLYCKIEYADLFYWETRHREHIVITNELRDKVESMTLEMRKYLSENYTPKVKPGKHCLNCSIADVCLPDMIKANKKVVEYVQSHIEEGFL